MNPGEREQFIRRILVALDASPASLASLEAAAELAAATNAELVGLFVEDINLVRLTSLSFLHEIGLFSAQPRRLELLTLERQLRAQANRARQALAMVSERAQVNWSFRVARGVVTAELLAAATEVDMVILGRAGWSRRRRRYLGSTARAVLAQMPRLTLLLHSGIRLGLPVLVIYDGTDVARQAIRATGQLLQGRQDGHVTVLLLADGPEAAQDLQHEVATQLERWGLEARYLWRSGATTQALVQAVQMEGCRLLVIPSNGSRLDRETVLSMLQEIDCPVLLVHE